MNFYRPTDGVNDWRPVLADPVKHGKREWSARTLAFCWESAEGLPPKRRTADPSNSVRAEGEWQAQWGNPKGGRKSEAILTSI